MSDPIPGDKAILDLLEGVKVLGVATKKVLDDGKVNLADLPVLLGLIQNFAVLTAAVQEANQVIPEAKSLTLEQVNEVIAKVLDVVSAIKAA